MTATFSDEDHEVLKEIVTGDEELSDLLIKRNVTSKSKQTELWCRLVSQFYDATNKMYTKEQIYNFIQRKRRAGVKHKLSGGDCSDMGSDGDIWALNPNKSLVKSIENLDNLEYVPEYEYDVKPKKRKMKKLIRSYESDEDDMVEDDYSVLSNNKIKTEDKLTDNLQLETELLQERLKAVKEEQEKVEEDIVIAEEHRERRRLEGEKRMEILQIIKSKLESGDSGSCLDALQIVTKLTPPS